MARTSKIAWETYKEQLLALKAEGKTLAQISAVLHEKLGTTVTAARLSQIFTGWKEQEDVKRNEELGKSLFEGQNAS